MLWFYKAPFWLICVIMAPILVSLIGFLILKFRKLAVNVIGKLFIVELILISVLIVFTVVLKFLQTYFNLHPLIQILEIVTAVIVAVTLVLIIGAGLFVVWRDNKKRTGMLALLAFVSISFIITTILWLKVMN